MGPIALELIELFSNLVDFKTGRLDPSIETLMRLLRRSRDAISRALGTLQAHGFLDRVRRFVRTNCEGRGPQIKQTSNAYRMKLPGFAEKLLGLRGQSYPEPDDFAQARLARANALDLFIKSLSLSERPLEILDDGPLARALSRLGSAIQKRESARQEESPSGSCLNFS